MSIIGAKKANGSRHDVITAVPTHGRQRQKQYYKNEVRLGYKVSFRPAWATFRDQTVKTEIAISQRSSIRKWGCRGLLP